MEIPQGLPTPAGTDVLRLHGALYGLKQSGRNWWLNLGKALTDQGFKREIRERLGFVLL